MNTKLNLKQHGLKLAMASAFVLGSVAMSGQALAATAQATTAATVITPIGITKAVDIEFGSFAPGAGGTVTVSTSGARTGSGVVLSAVTATPAAAKFDVTGTGSATYAISYSNTVLTHTNTVDTMALALVSDLTAGNATTGTAATGTLTAGAQSIYVGGVLTVGAAQVAGAYSGTVDVTVEYN